MEDLKEEKIINKLTNNSSETLKKIKSGKEDENNSNNTGKDNEDKANKNNLSLAEKNKNRKESEIDDNKELEMIKLSHIKKYTMFQIIKKSILFSSKNLKNPIYNLVKKFFGQYLDIRIPIVYGKLLNAIIKEKNYDLLCTEFRTHSFLLFSKVIFSELSELIGLLFINNSVLSYKRVLIDNIGRKDIEFFDLYKSGEVMSFIEKNDHVLEYNFIFKTIEVIMDFYNFFYLLFFLNTSSFTLTLLFFLVQAFKLLSDFLLKKYTNYKNRNTITEIYNKYNSFLYEFIDNIRLVKSLCVEDIHLGKLFPLKDKTNHQYCSIDGVLDPCIEFIHKMLDTYIIFVAGKYTIFNQINYSDLTIFQNYTNQLRQNFKRLKNVHHNYINIYNSWKRFFEVYDFENKVFSLKEYIPENESNFKYNIEFKNVNFSYPTRPSALIFNNLSLKIESGKKTAFVGYSGGGKSTLVTLIQRLYDPMNGVILLNDINLKDFNLKWLRHKIGFVSQEPMLFSGSIKENIVFGLEKYEEKYFKEICDMANLDFVCDKSKFPNGFNTLVGDKGSKISGGQKQRIAIARALMRDIKILVLDEATSALDSKNEKEVQDSIDKICKNKNITTILIAHRLSTVKNADIIMFVKDGTIVEKGSHKELLGKKGEYMKLVENQLIKTNLDVNID